jgi:hypothetical protein
LAVILESARWGDYRESIDGVTYTRNDYWIPEVNKVLNDYIPNRRDIVIGQLQRSDNLLYPKTAPPVFSKNGGNINIGESIEIDNPNSSAGTIVYTTNGTDPRKSGGDIGGVIYNSAIEINNAMLIKARILTSGNNEWSPLVENYYVTEDYQNSLMISEIMYHSGFNGIEFIELMNSGNTDINLIGLSFIDGIDYTFKKNTLLKPGEFIVLTNEMELFEALYNFKAYDVYTKRLSNKGETVILANYYGNIIDSVSYSDTIPWPILADGSGRSLELISPELDNSLYSSWKASDIQYGTPEEYICNTIDITYPTITKVQIYPNPATDWINIVIQGENFNNEDVFIEVYNNLGELIKKTAYYSDATMKININELEPGFYMLRIVNKTGTVKTAATKFLKLN